MTGSADRLSLVRAAYVVARRDFGAVLFSRAFFFFLLGPLFPLFVGVMAGGIGQTVENRTAVPTIGIAMQAGDVDRMLAARTELARQLGPAMPRMIVLRRLAAGEPFDARAVLARREGNFAAVLTGTSAAPVLTGTRERLQWWSGPVSLVAAAAQQAGATAYPHVATQSVVSSGASQMRGRMRTAQAGQVLLFLLIMLLAGMVLSNLVEEKGNKVIEILAAAIPMDAVFFGKLFAMLAISLVGIAVWGAVIGAVLGFSGLESMMGGVDLQRLPTPGVGWPLFLALGMAYFAMGYLLLGSIFLAIGSLATTVREVQTLSMPVTMLQLILFFFASLAITDSGDWTEWAAMAFPFSSPFAMLARAAMSEALWPHALALAWQGLWVALSIKFGAALFRKRVMQSGPRGGARRGWRRSRQALAEPGAAS